MIIKRLSRILIGLMFILNLFLFNITYAQIQDNKLQFINEVETFISFIDSINNNNAPLLYLVNFHVEDTCNSGFGFKVRYLWNNYELSHIGIYKEYFLFKEKIILIEKNETLPQWVNFDMIDVKIEERIKSSLLPKEEGIISDEGRMEYIHWRCGKMPKGVIRLCCGARFYAPDIIIQGFEYFNEIDD